MLKIEVLHQYIFSEKMIVNYDWHLNIRVEALRFLLKFCKKHKVSEIKLLRELRTKIKEYSKLSDSYEQDDLEVLLKEAVSSFLKKDKTKPVLVNNYLKSFLYPQFAMAKALQATVGRKKGLELYKKFVDVRTRSLPFPEVKRVKDLLAMNKKEILPPFKNSFNRTDFELDKGRAGCVVKKCRWHQVLKKLADPETAYAVACHYDFVAAKAMNKNFSLTRERTLMEGECCCDFVWHDLREVKNLVHPEGAFWEKL